MNAAEIREEAAYRWLKTAALLVGRVDGWSFCIYPDSSRYYWTRYGFAALAAMVRRER